MKPRTGGGVLQGPKADGEDVYQAVNQVESHFRRLYVQGKPPSEEDIGMLVRLKTMAMDIMDFRHQ